MPILTIANFTALPALSLDKIDELNSLINAMERSAYKCVFQNHASWLTFWNFIETGTPLPPTMNPLATGTTYGSDILPPLQDVVRDYMSTVVYDNLRHVMTQAGALAQKVEGGQAGLIYYHQHYVAIMHGLLWTKWLMENQIIDRDCEPPCKLKPRL